MDRRNLQAPDNLRREGGRRMDRFDLGVLALIAGWFVLALLGPFCACFLVFQMGLRWALYVLLAAIVVCAAFVMFAAPKESGSTLSSRFMTALAALVGLPVVGVGLLLYVGSALILGVIFWFTVLGLGD